ncbi:MAG: M24 family metallopeptidase [Nitrospinota bacterium]
MESLEIPSEEFAQRMKRAVEAAKGRGLAGLLVWSRGGTSVDYYGDVLYLTNHHSPFPHNSETPQWSARSYSALILPVDDDPSLVLDLPDYPKEKVYVDDVRTTLRVPQKAAEVLKEKGLDKAKLGLVGRECLLYHSYQLMEETLGHPLQVEPADDILEGLRRVKSGDEIRILKHAAAVGVEWMRTMMEAVEAGKTEGDFVGEGLRYFAAHGGFPYDVAVASGPNSHRFERIGIPSWDSKRKLQPGDIVHVDAWGPVECYYTDLVRSTIVGRKPSEAQREVLEAPIDLVESIIEIIKPGITVNEMYQRGSSWLVENGFGSHRSGVEAAGTEFGELFPAFGHCIGVGLEPPWIIDGEPTVLEENMVIAVEATVGRPDVGAAGFEQDVAVTSDGCEVLTAPCPKRWWD